MVEIYPMAVNLKNIEAERLLRELAREAGEDLTEAATKAFRERLDRLRKEHESAQVRISFQDLIDEARQNPIRDARSEKDVSDELWGDR